MKRGHLYREEASTFTSKWKRQYFAVERGSLRIFDSEAMNSQQLAAPLAGATVANTKTPRKGFPYAFRLEMAAPAPNVKLVLTGDTQADTDEWVAVFQLAGATVTYDPNANTGRRGSSLSAAVRSISASMSGHEEQQAMLGNSMRS